MFSKIKTRVRRLRHTLNKSKLITIKRELGKDVDDHKTSNTESLSQILFTFKRLFIKYHNRFQKSKNSAHETSPRKEYFLVMFKVHKPIIVILSPFFYIRSKAFQSYRFLLPFRLQRN